MAAHTASRSLFLGTFIHSKSLDELSYLHKTAVCVDEKGVIVALETNCDQAKAEETLYPQLGWSRGDVTVRTAKHGQFFFPGFIGLCCPLLSPSFADMSQTPISMPLSIRMLAFSANPPCSTGLTRTPSPWKVVLPLSPKPEKYILAASNEPFPMELPRPHIMPPSPCHQPISWQTSASLLAKEPSSAAAAWTICPQISTAMSQLLPL